MTNLISVIDVFEPRQLEEFSMDRCLFRTSAVVRSSPRFTSWLGIAAIALLAGCGGGGGSGGASTRPDVAPTGGSAQTIEGTGTVFVTVTDVFGTPAEGAEVQVYVSEISAYYGPLFTDADGEVTFTDVPAGTAGAWATGYETRGVPLAGGSEERRVPADGRLELAATVRPVYGDGFTGSYVGVGKAVVVPVSRPDRRVVEFSVPVFNLGRLESDVDVNFTLAECTPDPANDLPVHAPDCIAGSDGFDAEYTATYLGRTGIPADPPAPSFSAALLLDQSRNVVLNDPWGARLYGAKYFLATKSSVGRVALAAFASDDASSGEPSLLPQQPVTIFPVEDPHFTTGGGTLLGTVDLLEGLEGGAAPLYASVSQMIDFTAANAPSDGRRTVVVLTDGQDDTCGSPAECRSARGALGDKSRAAGVEVLAIGLAGPSSDGRALSVLAETSGGRALWVPEAGALGSVFAELERPLGGRTDTYEAHFRIESPTDGAFQPGHLVLGMLHIEFCWGSCWEAAVVPVAIQIP